MKTDIQIHISEYDYPITPSRERVIRNGMKRRHYARSRTNETQWKESFRTR